MEFGRLESGGGRILAGKSARCLGGDGEEGDG